MTIKETSVVLEAIRNSYPGRFSADAKDAESMLATWSSIFAEYEYNDVRYAVKAYIVSDTSGFPPSIGQIVAKISNAKVAKMPSSSEAWVLVRKAISNGIYGASEEFKALPPLIQKVVGGASQIYDWAMLDNTSLQVVESRFEKQYEKAMRSEEERLSLPSDVRNYLDSKADNEPKQLGNILGQITSRE